MKTCEHCGTKPIAGGNSRPARQVQKLRLCYTCCKDAGIRTAQRRKLGLREPTAFKRRDTRTSDGARCEHCRKRLIPEGHSRQSQNVAKHRLCDHCFEDKDIRKAQADKLGIRQRSSNPKKRKAEKARRRAATREVRARTAPVSRELDKAFDGFAQALAGVERIAEKELADAIARLGADATDLVACVRAAIARTFRQRKRLADMMAKLKLKANEGAADLRRRIAELKGAERDVRREIGKLPRPESEKHEGEE